MSYVRGLVAASARPRDVPRRRPRPASGGPRGPNSGRSTFPLRPTCFDPAETSGIITPFHGAVVLLAIARYAYAPPGRSELLAEAVIPTFDRHLLCDRR